MVKWVLFVWLSTNTPMAVYDYDIKEECLKAAAAYTTAVCVEVVVRKPR